MEDRVQIGRNKGSKAELAYLILFVCFWFRSYIYQCSGTTSDSMYGEILGSVLVTLCDNGESTRISLMPSKH